MKSTQSKVREDEKAEISRLRKEFAYLEAFSRRENLTVEGIWEVSTEAEKLEDKASVMRTWDRP